MKKRNIEMALPYLDQHEEDAIIDVIKSKRLALGPKIKEFEKTLADYTGRKHAIATSSGTAGLHLAMLSCGIGPGDEVLVPSYTFVASVNCILYVGATPVFVDIDEETYCLCPSDVKRKITSKTKAIISVDVFGHPAPLVELEKISKDHGLFLIDDSCEALGAAIGKRKVGSFGDFASFAFYPNKQITTGEGGMLLTDNDELARLSRMYLNQGRDTMSQWLEHAVLGYNYRLSEVSAAIGIAQMKKLNTIINAREAVAFQYQECLKDIAGVSTQVIKEDCHMSWFVFVITLDKNIDRDFIIKELAHNAIPARAYFTPIHTQPYLKKYKTKAQGLDRTNNIGRRTLALPFHAQMSRDDIVYVSEHLERAISKSFALNKQSAA